MHLSENDFVPRPVTPVLALATPTNSLILFVTVFVTIGSAALCALMRFHAAWRMVTWIAPSNDVRLWIQRVDRPRRARSQRGGRGFEPRAVHQCFSTLVFACCPSVAHRRCEIAAAPEVRDEAAIRRHFERIGDRTSWSRDSYETAAAVEIERRVLNEVQRVR